MPIITTNTGRKIFRKADSLLVIPYVYNSTYGDYVLGDTAYDLSSIIGDSITLEQDDGDTQTKECEFYSEPVVKNVTMGEIKITAQCLDLQNAVLRALFGSYYNNSAGASAIRKDYETLYALIRIRFSEEDTPDVYLPQVLLNSKLLLQQMKTRGAQGNLGGTVLARVCSVIDSGTSLLSFSDPVKVNNVYQIETPILMLTAKDTVPDKVSGLNSGADDYMTKPFAPEELLARIKALTRRRGEVMLDETGFGDFSFNASTSELSKGAKSVRLNFKEAEILKLLLANRDTIISKEDIITKVWGYDSDAGSNNVEAYVSFLRRKLNFINSSTEIKSIKKMGYRLEQSHD